MSLSNTRSDHARPDHSGRWVALPVFLIGIGILIFVFVTALHLFESPVPGLEPLQTAGAAPPSAVNIGTSLAEFARKLLLLGVMTLAGSLLANKGAHLYFSTVYLHAPAPSAAAARNGHSSKVIAADESKAE